MNYLGSISILDRGDAPAQAVIDRNARSLAQRVVDETRDELNKVMSRVHTIYGAMDAFDDAYSNPSMEYLADLAELEAVLKDEIKKRQYQQQITIFIVGYQDVCHQKLRLIQQVNEFFMENSKTVDEEEWFPSTPEIDLDEVSSAVEDSLNHAHELTNRLAELNREVMDYIQALAEKKANNRGRKKLEKALQQTRDEVNNLKEKLQILQNDLAEREDKLQGLFKQLDIKNLDTQKFRTAAELGKQKLILLQKELDEQIKSNEETKTSLMKLLDNQMQVLQENHKQEMDELRRQYETQYKQLQDGTSGSGHEVVAAEQRQVSGPQVSNHSLKQESSPTTKASKVVSKSSLGGSKQQISKSPIRAKAELKLSSRTNVAKSEKEFAEVSVQEEGAGAADEKVGLEAAMLKSQSKNNIQSVMASSHDSALDLSDEQAWASVPEDEIKGRFAQYRQLSLQRVQELEEELQLTTAKTQRKVASLKSQFQEHKNKWEAERKLLIEQVDQTLQFKSDAEKEADAALTQLEDFITEQERLEQEEEARRSEALRPSTSLTPQEAHIADQGLNEQASAPETTPHHSSISVVTPESEQELQRLMQQTDDAKVQEMNARLGTCVSGPPAVDMECSAPLIAESHSSIEGVKREDKKEEEVRISSSMSLASLREQYKAKLEEVKLAAESRRSKSPAITLPTQLTVDDELVLEDDDDFEDDNLDHKDPSMHEVGTSPPPDLRRTSRDHVHFSRAPSHLSRSNRSDTNIEPLLLAEYLRAYDSVVNFKQRVAKIFLDKDMMSAYQMTSDLETLTFDNSKRTIPQVEELTKNILYILEELTSIISNHLVYDREPPVSSLNLLSREHTRKSPSESLSGQSPGMAGSKDAGHSVITSHPSRVHSQSSSSSDKQIIQELQDQYNLLKKQLQEDGKSHEEQLQRNSVVMKEMQNTINELQQELSSLGRTGLLARSSMSGDKKLGDQSQSPSPETSIMFTRLDSERNAKIMKKAVMEEKLDRERYKEAVSKMDEYISLPAKRFINLVKKYIHYTRTQEIEEKVKTSSTMQEEVLSVLGKMENLQNQRNQQWTDKMSGMGGERLKLANLLMNTLNNIEQESGIFLIKPMYSYRGRDIKPDRVCKLSRPIRHRHRRMPSNAETAGSFVPAPTPDSGYHQIRQDNSPQYSQQQKPVTEVEMNQKETKIGQDSEEVYVTGSGIPFNTSSPGTTWSTSQPLREEQARSISTPRILELDINRMLIGQNNISSKLPFQPTDDKLVNLTQNSLRSYVTVQRPTVSLGMDKPASAGVSVRPTAQKVSVSKVDQEIPRALPSPHPLPPITPSHGEELKEREIEGGV